MECLAGEFLSPVIGFVVEILKGAWSFLRKPFYLSVFRVLMNTIVMLSSSQINARREIQFLDKKKLSPNTHQFSVLFNGVYIAFFGGCINIHRSLS